MTKLRDITPSQYKCQDTLSCPAVFRFHDGRYAVRGTVHEFIGGTDECTVIIDPKMIAEAVSAEEQRGGAK